MNELWHDNVSLTRYFIMARMNRQDTSSIFADMLRTGVAIGNHWGHYKGSGMLGSDMARHLDQYTFITRKVINHFADGTDGFADLYAWTDIAVSIAELLSENSSIDPTVSRAYMNEYNNNTIKEIVDARAGKSIDSAFQNILDTIPELVQMFSA